MSMSNFEAHVRQKILSFQHEIAALHNELARAMMVHAPSPQHSEAVAMLQAQLERANREHHEYMLSTLPFVKQYFEQPAEAQKDMALVTNAQGQQRFGQSHVQQRAVVFRRYMNEVERQPGFAEPQPATKAYDVCADCKDAPCLIIDREFLTCPECGRCYPSSNMSFNNLSFEQQTNDIVQIACYRRSNHFAEWLSKLQAREITKVPDDVMTSIKVELKKQRLVDPKNVTQAKVKEILKRLKLAKWYEHVPTICCIITNTSAPKFPPALEERLKQLFDEIQEPFERFKGAKRSNMLSYGFLLYKFCELLGEDEFLPYLPLLKSTQKLWDCDQVWKKICLDRHWEFVPTV